MTMFTNIKLYFLLVPAAFLSACATVVDTPQAPAATSVQAEQAWASVLNRYVNQQGEVDFVALSLDRANLDRYVRYIADTPYDHIADADTKMAHLVNAYNALSMYNVIESGIPITHAGFNKVTFFLLRQHQIGRQTISLYGFENDVIRPIARQQNDPRIHFALNCSAVSCPVLPRVPFTAAGLQQELERETKAFFARIENYRVDDAKRVVWLNEILSFYTEDFAPRPAKSLIEYVNRYVAKPAPLDYEVRFTPYDWTIANSRIKK